MAIEDSDCVRVVSTAHGSVRVRDVGAGGGVGAPPVLLVHALLVDGGFYSALEPRLVARGYRCITPDLPLGAHRPAMRPDADLTPGGLARLLVEVLDALDVATVDVVGVDTGGALTQLLMAGHTDRVRAAVLTACDAYDAFPPRSFGWLIPVLRLPGSLWLTAQMARSRQTRKLATLRSLTHAGVDDTMLRRWTAPMLDGGVRRDLAKVLAGMTPSVTMAAAEANRDFPRPVLVAWGDDDRIFPRRLGERLAADIPGARLVTIADCAAFAALDQPDVLAELIDGHLQGVLR